MDNWDYLGLFTVALALSEVANRLNIQLNSVKNVYVNNDNSLLLLIIGASYAVAFYCLMTIYFRAVKSLR